MGASMRVHAKLCGEPWRVAAWTCPRPGQATLAWVACAMQGARSMPCGHPMREAWRAAAAWTCPRPEYQQRAVALVSTAQDSTAQDKRWTAQEGDRRGELSCS